MCLIHGPFGCGKSSLLVALIHYLLAQRSQAGSSLKGCRVLLSAHTNVAVDRLMTGLLDTGCTGTARLSLLGHTAVKAEASAWRHACILVTLMSPLCKGYDLSALSPRGSS